MTLLQREDGRRLSVSRDVSRRKSPFLFTVLTFFARSAQYAVTRTVAWHSLCNSWWFWRSNYVIYRASSCRHVRKRARSESSRVIGRTTRARQSRGPNLPEGMESTCIAANQRAHTCRWRYARTFCASVPFHFLSFLQLWTVVRREDIFGNFTE